MNDSSFKCPPFPKTIDLHKLDLKRKYAKFILFYIIHVVYEIHDYNLHTISTYSIPHSIVKMNRFERKCTVGARAKERLVDGDTFVENFAMKEGH